MKEMITVNIASYRRPEGVETLDYLPFCQVWVAESEYEDYKRANKDAKIIEVPDSVQGNLSRVRNYILDKEFERGVKGVCIVDDDMQRMGYYEHKEHFNVATEDFMLFLKKYTILAFEAGVRIWGVNVNSDKKCYKEYAPFSLTSYIGGPFAVHLPSDLRYDERFVLKSDYDFTLQHLNKYRRVLRVNKFHYFVKQGGSCSGQTGGCAVQRNLKKEMKMFKLLQKKWGKDIIAMDNADFTGEGKRKLDINPILKSPIRGI